MVLKPEYLNVSGTQKSVKEDVNAQADSLKKEQDSFDANIMAIKDTVERENGTISIKMDPEIYVSLYTSGRDLSYVLYKIGTQAENIRRQEKEAEKERVRKEQELLEKERLEQERQNQHNTAVQVDVPPVPSASSQQACDVGVFSGYNPFIVPATAPTSAETQETRDVHSQAHATEPNFSNNTVPAAASALWQVNYLVTGSYETLWKLNEYINANDIQKVILSQGPITQEE